MKHLSQRKVARVLFDEGHNESWTIDEATARRMQPAHPADSSYAQAAQALRERDFIVERNADQPLINPTQTLSQTDVLVIAHPSDTKWEHTTAAGSPLFSADEIGAIQAFVHAGGGLIVMGETEQDKYGNNVNELLRPFGIRIENATLTDHAHCHNNVPSWVFASPLPFQGEGLGVSRACFLRAGVLSVQGAAKLVMRASSEASTANAGLVAAAQYGLGRVVVFADSDLFGDDDLHQFDHKQLWLNACYWVAEAAFARNLREVPGTSAIPIASATHLSWQQLKQATNDLRKLQKADGALAEAASRAEAEVLVTQMRESITALQPHFPHQQKYLDCVLRDLQGWADGGFVKPDFTQSLAAFRPELKREDEIEHLVVFPLYTPNGSPETKFEVLLVRVPWPDWLAELERTQFDNAKFVPLHFVDHTEGYASECAVLFPETVSMGSVGGKPTNHFGGIFCDREAARYQRVVGAACKVMNVNVSPQVTSFLQSSDLIRDMFALWDLIHDRWHSHGELPFDPFMIRQRLPYWMYSLEELRVDLQTYGSASELERDGFAFARYVKYGILFDRIFRFPITGNRVRNYDGLGGQLLFAFLHKQGVAQWRDNALTIDWARLDGTVAALRERVEQLYRDGIDSTKVQYWLSAHDLVSEWVKPNLGSKWAKETRVLSDESKPKEWVDRVLDDEFPLSLFYLQLQKKLQNAEAMKPT